MYKQKFDDYYVGLDIGTSSVGWAVTNSNYKVLKFNKKSMWGVRKFGEASTAEGRRIHRTSRRRLARRKFRLDILRNIFKDELNKISPSFIDNLEESTLHSDEKSTKDKWTLFNDDNYRDKDYYEKYPTIYHLRYELISNPNKHDVREVYLALHHILKYRGHFLFDGELNSESNIDEAFKLINDSAINLYDYNLFVNDLKSIEQLKNILKDSKLRVRDRTTAIKRYVNPEIDKDTKKIFNKIATLIAGGKVSNINDIFPELEIDEKISIDFKSNSIDENLDKLTILDFDQMQLINYAKAIYDWGLLEELRDGEEYLSVAKINSYNQHARDLAELKQIVRKGASKETYNDFFHNEDNKSNYAAYVGNSNTKTATTEDFYKAVKRLIKKVDGFDEIKKSIEFKIESQKYMPKQRVGSNSVIPHQLHLIELEKILENARTYLPFLNKKDSNGLTNVDKIISTFTFRIPYYVGPLNPYHSIDNEQHGTAWVRRKKQGKVYPWNFEDMIDVPASAEKFIDRMTNKCSYLVNEKVLPKHSLLYQKYMVLNEINNLKINGTSIDVKVKQHLFKDLFVKQLKNITKKQITKWLMDNNYVSRKETIVITGIDDQIKSKLTTFHDMKQIFGEKLPDSQMLETIIYWITIFSDGKDILEKKIKNEYGNKLTDKQIKLLRNKNYGGWGRLSGKLLEGLADTTYFLEPTSIIQAMYTTNYNFMELLTDQFSYYKKIEIINQERSDIPKKLDYSIIDELQLSPAVKRPIWQTLNLMDELISITGSAPNKIFIEMARGSGTSGKRTKSRKNQLIELYKNIGTESELLGELINTDESKLRQKKLYLYYTQRGKCMYSGKYITLSELYDKNLYDLDHIYPRSLTKDDSLNNLVLVKKELNKAKGDTYPIDRAISIPSHVYQFWKSLKDQGLISNTKYERLIRKEPLTNTEKAGFIARQIVETRQSTKTVANIFKQLYPETEIVFVKASLVSDFRNEQTKIDEKTGEIMNPDYQHYIKLRNLNDYHHAKDAYLNIVVGNVYHTKFTSNPLNYINTNNKRSYNLGRMYDWKIERNNQIAWIPGRDGTIKRVNKMMKRHDILTTWMTTDGKGGLFDQNLTKKGKGQVSIKKGKDIAKYGGYNNVSTAYFVVVEHQRRKDIIRTIETIPLYLKEQLKTEKEIENYLSHELGLINPKLIYNHIQINTILEYDGIRARITGKNGNTFVMRNEVQLVMKSHFNSILKEIEKFSHPNNQLSIDKFNIPYELLTELYLELLDKGNTDLYKAKVNNFIETLNKGVEIIPALSKEELVQLIQEVLKLFQSTRENSDLRMLGGSRQAGALTLGKNISTKESMVLVHQSITGLFENRVDLLK